MPDVRATRDERTWRRDALLEMARRYAFGAATAADLEKASEDYEAAKRKAEET